MRRKQSTRVALGGISASLALTLLFLSSLFPFALYAVPAMAGIALLPIGIELGLSVAGVSYAAVALLGLLILPDREVAMLFLSFFGYYPILKLKIDRAIHSRLLLLLIKFVLFNTAMIGCYGVLILLFGMTQVASELKNGFGLLLLAIGNVTFPIYELALRNVLIFYRMRIQSILFRDR